MSYGTLGFLKITVEDDKYTFFKFKVAYVLHKLEASNSLSCISWTLFHCPDSFQNKQVPNVHCVFTVGYFISIVSHKMEILPTTS